LKLRSWRATCLDVAHFNLLLLKGIARLGFAMVECAIGLLTSAFYLLTDTVVFALLFAQLSVLIVPFLLQLGGIVSVEFAQLLGARTENLEGVGKLGNEGASELVMFGCARFEGV
jgi:hypothetical protein